MSARRFGRGSLRPKTVGGQPCWEADWRNAQGKRFRRLVGRTKAEAQAVLAKMIRDRDLELAGMGVERGLAMSLSELDVQYLAELDGRAKPTSVGAARAALGRLERELGARTVRDLSVPLVMAWRARRVAAGTSNRTANTDVGYLKAALALAVRMGQLTAHPLAGIRGLPVGAGHQRRRPRALADGELRRLFHAADELDREAPTLREGRIAPLPRAPLVRALALTGARWGELTSATWADLDPEAGTLALRAETTKNGRARSVPITPGLLEELLSLPLRYAARIGRRPTPGSPIFLSPEGRPWARGRSNFYRHLRDVFLRAGIPHVDELGRVVHVHALRHTFATRLARAGVPIAVAQRLTGHRTASLLLEVYTHLRDEECRKAVEGLPTLTVGGRLASTATDSDSAERASTRGAT